jgi:hypothetical protein
MQIVCGDRACWAAAPPHRQQRTSRGRRRRAASLSGRALEARGGQMRKQMRSTFRTRGTEDRVIKGNAQRSRGAENPSFIQPYVIASLSHHSFPGSTLAHRFSHVPLLFFKWYAQLCLRGAIGSCHIATSAILIRGQAVPPRFVKAVRLRRWCSASRHASQLTKIIQRHAPCSHYSHIVASIC